MTERKHGGGQGHERAREALEHAPHGHGGAHPPAEEDRVRSWTIVSVGVGALVVFAIASVAVGVGMRRQQRELRPDGPAPMPAELGKAKIGIVEQRLFEHSNQAEAMHRVQRRKLETYGWIDPAQGVVRMPIERGMQLVLEGQRPAATQAPAGQPAAPPSPADAGAPRGRSGGARGDGGGGGAAPAAGGTR
jgi:hypothetical protein